MLRPRRRQLLGALGLALLGGCGFHLRGERALPFETLFISGAIDGDLLRLIRRRVSASGTTTIPARREEAAMVLELLAAGRDKTIIGLSGAGKVREYAFHQTLRFRLVDREGRQLIPETQLAATREATWDDAAILAKDQEEALLYRDMQDELVRQLLRRLEAVHIEG